MTNQVMTQEQHFYKAHRETSDLLQQAYWMAGKMKDSQGRVNNNPMTDAEIRAAAESDKPYAWAFQMILEGRETAASEQINELNGAEDQYRCLGVSTAHITEADCEHLQSIDSSRVMSRATGAFVKLYLHPNIPGYNHTLPGFSDEFYNVLHAAQSAGFRMVEFDSDADTYDSLPIIQG